ncbi:uncharacterized protein [Triticum aestivum]|uniref:uncharacterized protein n=1 Tax=Triticum aestivum TaxID=4565 RepID=UPI00084242DE|nr:uncharacterized protein LOC123093624 [Triticum aestivum]XP_044371560.1 uncharacterized protein LOC123093624 [Triticum aestivum]XP_044371561.1 uncharacterized protein LOC123093624 [Triticum aestivum]XP_044371562.1 uncharacterized protein LOC123093624 [Triticum aestivum]XP_044371563.1 uncharacterized protein LOC123093624 [Triticum aestivum]XP_044371564.1 uncharacterized protein LOC123093624 [Triticum aestivum]XP_044371565.1 uncharacterized protein LOC123093624 [Triticum aestivum]XP_04437156
MLIYITHLSLRNKYGSTSKALVLNQSISETTFGKVSDFIQSFASFAKKDEPRAFRRPWQRFQERAPSPMMLLTAPASSWQVRSASPRYSVSGERAGLHFWITASLPNLLAMWKVVALWGTVSKREPLKWLDVEGNCTCFISLFFIFFWR